MPLPLLGAISAGAGLVQSVLGGIQAHKAQKQLENLKTPTTQSNQSVMDYYNAAKARYNVNPFQSASYRAAMQQGDRNFATGLSGLQDRRSGVMGIAALQQGANDQAIKAAASAEGQQGQQLAQLGHATALKADDDKYVFNINQMMPYEKQAQLLSMKAQGGNQIMNSGLNNVFSGIGSMQEQQNMKDIYGTYSQRSGK